MVYFELCANRSEAAEREHYIRKLKPAEKQALADAMGDDMRDELPR
jgi:predicted GIY-YIG superfamily endonuclease